VARKIIESCQNVADLKKWVKQELPDEIMLLVLKRLRKFRIDPDEFSNDLSGEEDTLDADITPEGGGNDGQPEEDGKTPENEDGGNDGQPEEDPEDEDRIPDFDGSGGGNE
jgi:hypothetical protein